MHQKHQIRFGFSCSDNRKSGSKPKIWLKAKRDFTVIVHSSALNQLIVPGLQTITGENRKNSHNMD
jgi:hypothetical protein